MAATCRARRVPRRWAAVTCASSRAGSGWIHAGDAGPLGPALSDAIQVPARPRFEVVPPRTAGMADELLMCPAQRSSHALVLVVSAVLRFDRLRRAESQSRPHLAARRRWRDADRLGRARSSERVQHQ